MIKRILCSLLLCCIPPAVHAGAVFQERGDAGDFASPQDVVGTSIERIQGSIGGDDGIDVFRFHFAGGPLAILARLDGPGQEALPIRLVRERSLPDDTCFAGSTGYPPNPCISDGWLTFSADMLAPGNYLLGVCAFTQGCVADDPPFTIDFLSGTGADATAATIGSPVPEPGVLTLVGLALLGIWGIRRAVVAEPRKASPSGGYTPYSPGR